RGEPSADSETTAAMSELPSRAMAVTRSAESGIPLRVGISASRLGQSLVQRVISGEQYYCGDDLSAALAVAAIGGERILPLERAQGAGGDLIRRHTGAGRLGDVGLQQTQVTTLHHRLPLRV